MEDDKGFFVLIGLLCGILVSVLAGWALIPSPGAIRDTGRIDIVSGQVMGELVERDDKTTYWVFTEAEVK